MFIECYGINEACEDIYLFDIKDWASRLLVDKNNHPVFVCHREKENGYVYESIMTIVKGDNDEFQDLIEFIFELDEEGSNIYYRPATQEEIDKILYHSIEE